MSARNVTLLVVDDDDIDRMAVRRGLKKLGLSNDLVEASDGLAALDLLRGAKDQAPLEKPYIILLDINMPRMNGIEFLDELRADPKLRYTPVFVWSTSSADADKTRAYERGVAGYLVKGDCGADLSEALQLLKSYWETVQLPA